MVDPHLATLFHDLFLWWLRSFFGDADLSECGTKLLPAKCQNSSKIVHWSSGNPKNITYVINRWPSLNRCSDQEGTMNRLSHIIKQIKSSTISTSLASLLNICHASNVCRSHLAPNIIAKHMRLHSKSDDRLQYFWSFRHFSMASTSEESFKNYANILTKSHVEFDQMSYCILRFRKIWGP